MIEPQSLMYFLILSACIFAPGNRFDKNHGHETPSYDGDSGDSGDTGDTGTPDSTDSADSNDSADSADTSDTSETWVATNGTIVAWGAGGLYVSGADGFTFMTLSEAAPDGVNIGKGSVTARSGNTAIAYDMSSGAATLNFGFTCPNGGTLTDALLVPGTAYGICDDSLGSRVVLGAFDGSTTDTGVGADGLQWDNGSLFLYEDWGRAGGRLHAVDATTLIATGADATTGFNAEARGAGYFSSFGVPGTDTAGGYTVGTWSDASATESFALPDGEFVNALDVLAGRATLVDARSWPGLAPSALLIDGEGAVVAELAACETPRLVSRDTGYVESWCTAPLTRTTWTNDAGVWTAAETQSFADLDVSHLRVIETVD